jgi:hypothetical protein
MRIVSKWILVSGVVSLAVLLSMIAGLPAVQGQASFVRWDIISFDPTTTPNTFRPGGVAFAAAPDTLMIKLTGSGTFVAPASGGTSSGATGGGTWETFTGATSTGSGKYQVTELISWQFANFAAGPAIDLIDDGTRANGNSVLRIVYDDGSEGVLGVGCRGASPHPGILEGVIATKGLVTYWNAQKPVPGVNANRTLFHVR